MLVSCESDIKTIKNRIQEMKDIETTVKGRKKQIKKSVELFDGIIADGAISDTHLRMLWMRSLYTKRMVSLIFK